MNKEKVIEDFIKNHKSCWKEISKGKNLDLDKDGYPVVPYDIYQPVCFSVSYEDVLDVYNELFAEEFGEALDETSH